MKVFEVITEQHSIIGAGKPTMTQSIIYVTHECNSLLGVTEYFNKHCEEYEECLIGVRELLVIAQHIESK